MEGNRGAMSARNTVSYLQWLLPAIGEAAQQRRRQQRGLESSVLERGTMIKMAADMSLAQSSNRRQYHWCRALRLRLQRCGKRKALQTRRLVRKKKPMASLRRRRERSLLSLKGRGSEVEGVKRRVRELKRLLPGGRGMALENLFEETADYIMALQGQVTAMKALASFFESVGDEKKRASC